jgi:hypothetical protein
MSNDWGLYPSPPEPPAVHWSHFTCTRCEEVFDNEDMDTDEEDTCFDCAEEIRAERFEGAAESLREEAEALIDEDDIDLVEAARSAIKALMAAREAAIEAAKE